jgi:tRNA pseudouridine65 synthase
MNSKVLEVIYHDTHLIAINKPHGLLVHASSIAAEATEHAVQQLRDQTGKWVFPVHRLDRKTAGVLLFAFDQETNSLMQQMFMEHKVEKVYHAIVRGYTPDEGTIDYPLTNDSGKVREAITRYRTLGRTELPVPVGKFATSRYSLVEVKPLTGRMHQIRKHFAHIFHPIIGDRPHGCNKQNRLFLEKWGHREMLLHAVSLTFNHPHLGESVHLKAQYQPTFLKIAAEMGFSLEG